MNDHFRYSQVLAVCKRHAERLLWSRKALSHCFPLTAITLEQLDDIHLAILDQFSMRFSKLQDAMGAKLFPATLDLIKEQGELAAFLDKLNRLEKVGAVVSAEQWLLLREMRNQFSHDYPEDPELRAAVLNRAYRMAEDLLLFLEHIECFAVKYLPVENTKNKII